ncbi:hypothetical protein [Pedobacter agri]|uniref:SMI1/KNR4 family protein n=1 Tax=Pedobacter agri TaxID=454586 RepID=A0A9X3DE15_9SPHI|nr:hypothetical protein [Pedobacter agri]MCX3265582.1 hypothetical protein [Pedobacter agri]
MKGIKETEDYVGVKPFYDMISTNTEKNYIDFFYSDDRKNRSKNLIGFDSDQLIYVGNTKGADYIFICLKGENRELLNNPLVYVSSEGDPWEFFAQNFDEFLSLLYFGISIIPDTLININAYQYGIGLEGLKEKIMNEDYFLRLNSLLTSTFPGFIEFRKRLVTDFKINQHANPIDLIFHAKSRNPSFTQWISNMSNQ